LIFHSEENAAETAYCINRGGIELCSPVEWSRILASKITSISVSSGVCIGTKLSLYRRFLLRVLGVKLLKQKDSTGIWAVTRGNLTSECSEIQLVDLSEGEWLQLYSTKLPKILALPLAEPIRVMVFMAVGISGIFVNMFFALAAFQMLHVHGFIAAPVASTVGFETSILWNFTLHEKVTFRKTALDMRLKSVIIRLVKYHAASLGSWVAQVTMSTIITLLLGKPFFWIGQLVGIVLGFIVNFILGYVYTWSMHRI
jgi:putative flippase GtrA